MTETKIQQTLLLFEVGTSRMAVPLSQVDRLEEFRRSATEQSGRQNVVQYREKIMPLIDLSRYFEQAPSSAAAGSDSFQVVVTSRDGRRIGLVVDRILDIVEDHVDLDSVSARKGLLGSALIQNRVTDFIDVESVLLDAGLAKEAA